MVMVGAARGLVAVVGMSTVLVAAWAGPACGDRISVEGGPVVGLFPDRGIDLGGRIGLGLWTAPENWLVIGGHALFVDFLLVNGIAGAGSSISLSKDENARGTRVGMALWRSGGEELGWEVYLSYGVPVAVFGH